MERKGTANNKPAELAIGRKLWEKKKKKLHETPQKEGRGSPLTWGNLDETRVIDSLLTPSKPSPTETTSSTTTNAFNTSTIFNQSNLLTPAPQAFDSRRVFSGSPSQIEPFSPSVSMVSFSTPGPHNTSQGAALNSTRVIHEGVSQNEPHTPFQQQTTSLDDTPPRTQVISKPSRPSVLVAPHTTHDSIPVFDLEEPPHLPQDVPGTSVNSGFGSPPPHIPSPTIKQTVLPMTPSEDTKDDIKDLLFSSPTNTSIGDIHYGHVKLSPALTPSLSPQINPTVSKNPTPVIQDFYFSETLSTPRGDAYPLPSPVLEPKTSTPATPSWGVKTNAPESPFLHSKIEPLSSFGTPLTALKQRNQLKDALQQLTHENAALRSQLNTNREREIDLANSEWLYIEEQMNLLELELASHRNQVEKYEREIIPQMKESHFFELEKIRIESEKSQELHALLSQEQGTLIESLKNENEALSKELEALKASGRHDFEEVMSVMIEANQVMKAFLLNTNACLDEQSPKFNNLSPDEFFSAKTIKADLEHNLSLLLNEFRLIQDKKSQLEAFELQSEELMHDLRQQNQSLSSENLDLRNTIAAMNSLPPGNEKAEVALLTSELESSRQVASELQSSLDVLRVDNESLSSRIALLSAEIEASKQESQNLLSKANVTINQLTAANGELQDAHAAGKTLVDTLRAELREKEAALAAFESTIEKQPDSTFLESKIRFLEDEKTSLVTRMQDLESQVLAYSQSIIDKDKTILAVNRESQSLKFAFENQSEQMRASYEQQVDALRATHSAEILSMREHHQSALQASHAEIAELVASRKVLESNILSKDAELAKGSVVFEKFQLDQEHASSQLAQQYLAKLEELRASKDLHIEQVESQQNLERQSFQTAMTSLRDQCRNQEKLLLDDKAEMAALNAELQALKSNASSETTKLHESFESQLKDLKSSYQNNIDSLKNSHSDTLQAYQKQIDSLSATVDDLRGRLKSKTEEFDSIHREADFNRSASLKELEKMKSMYTSQLESLKAEHDKQVLLVKQNSNSSHLSTTHQIAELLDQINSKTRDLTQRDLQLSSLQDSLAQIKSESEKKMNTLSELHKGQLDSLNKRHTDHVLELSEKHNSKVLELQKTLSSVSGQYKSHETIIASKDKELRLMKLEMETLKSINSEQLELISSLKNENSQLRTNASEAAALIERLKGELTEKVNHISSLVNDVETLRSQKKEVDAQLKETKDKSFSELKALTDSNQELEIQVNDLNDKLETLETQRLEALGALESELKSTKRAHSNANNLIAALQSEAADNRAIVTQLREENAGLQNQLSELSGQKEELIGQLVSLKSSREVEDFIETTVLYHVEKSNSPPKKGLHRTSLEMVSSPPKLNRREVLLDSSMSGLLKSEYEEKLASLEDSKAQLEARMQARIDDLETQLQKHVDALPSESYLATLVGKHKLEIQIVNMVVKNKMKEIDSLQNKIYQLQEENESLARELFYQSGDVRIFVALYSYDPMATSPNDDKECELRFSRGDIIFTFGSVDDDGFYEGRLSSSGAHGLVPSTYVAEVKLNELAIQLLKALQSSPCRLSRVISPVDVVAFENKEQIISLFSGDLVLIFESESSLLSPSLGLLIQPSSQVNEVRELARNAAFSVGVDLLSYFEAVPNVLPSHFQVEISEQEELHSSRLALLNASSSVSFQASSELMERFQRFVSEFALLQSEVSNLNPRWEDLISQCQALHHVFDGRKHGEVTNSMSTNDQGATESNTFLATQMLRIEHELASALHQLDQLKAQYFAETQSMQLQLQDAEEHRLILQKNCDTFEFGFKSKLLECESRQREIEDLTLKLQAQDVAFKGAVELANTLSEQVQAAITLQAKIEAQNGEFESFSNLKAFELTEKDAIIAELKERILNLEQDLISAFEARNTPPRADSKVSTSSLDGNTSSPLFREIKAQNNKLSEENKSLVILNESLTQEVAFLSNQLVDIESEFLDQYSSPRPEPRISLARLSPSPLGKNSSLGYFEPSPQLSFEAVSPMLLKHFCDLYRQLDMIFALTEHPEMSLKNAFDAKKEELASSNIFAWFPQEEETLFQVLAALTELMRNLTTKASLNSFQKSDSLSNHSLRQIASNNANVTDIDTSISKLPSTSFDNLLDNDSPMFEQSNMLNTTQPKSSHEESEREEMNMSLMSSQHGLLSSKTLSQKEEEDESNAMESSQLNPNFANSTRFDLSQGLPHQASLVHDNINLFSQLLGDQEGIIHALSSLIDQLHLFQKERLIDNAAATASYFQTFLQVHPLALKLYEVQRKIHSLVSNECDPMSHLAPSRDASVLIAEHHQQHVLDLVEQVRSLLLQRNGLQETAVHLQHEVETLRRNAGSLSDSTKREKHEIVADFELFEQVNQLIGQNNHIMSEKLSLANRCFHLEQMRADVQERELQWASKCHQLQGLVARAQRQLEETSQELIRARESMLVLDSQAKRYYLRFLKAESHRKSLSFQKKYFTFLLPSLSLVIHPSGPAPKAFRSVVYAVMAAWRIRFLVFRWAKKSFRPALLLNSSF